MYKAVFRDANKKQILINGLYKGASAFLCCSGPSLLNQDLTKISGMVTLGVNNSPIALRKHGGFSPNFWTMTDDVKNFCKSIYEDPKIIKFLPDGKVKHRLWDNNAWKESKKRVRECPGVVYYSRPPGLEEFFSVDTFIDDSRFCWGNHARRCACGHTKKEGGPKECPDCGSTNTWGSRSCMLVAVRILYELGFKNVFLLGCDFRMEKGKANYAFEQDRSSGSVRNNNNTYRMLNDRFDALQPLFQKIGYNVWNCYEDSGLKSFPYKPFDEALEIASVVPIVDRTEGLYDRKAKAKEAKREEENCTRLDGKPETLDEFVRMAGQKLQATIIEG